MLLYSDRNPHHNLALLVPHLPGNLPGLLVLRSRRPPRAAVSDPLVTRNSVCAVCGVGVGTQLLPLVTECFC